MGGNALNFETRRVSRREFNELTLEVGAILDQLGIKFFPIVCYEDKESFGDLDLIVTKRISPVIDPEIIAQAFGSKDRYLNSNVWSFDYKDFQVDLIITEPHNVDASRFYFSYNDMGNLIGRIYHKMGLKFGHTGLEYIVRNGNYPFGEICLSQNPRTILEFLGLSWYTYIGGFKKLEEIFQFVSSSKYFNPDIFLFENVNHQSRTRDKKRPTYNAFLGWCAKQQDLFRYNFPENKDEWIPLIGNTFPNFYSDFATLKDQIERTQLFKEFFNGEIVSEITGLSGKPLGVFMSELRTSLGGKEEFMEIALTRGKEWVKSVILDKYVKMKKDDKPVNYYKGYDKILEEVKYNPILEWKHIDMKDVQDYVVPNF